MLSDFYKHMPMPHSNSMMGLDDSVDGHIDPIVMSLMVSVIDPIIMSVMVGVLDPVIMYVMVSVINPIIMFIILSITYPVIMSDRKCHISS